MLPKIVLWTFPGCHITKIPIKRDLVTVGYDFTRRKEVIQREKTHKPFNDFGNYKYLVVHRSSSREGGEKGGVKSLDQIKVKQSKIKNTVV